MNRSTDISGRPLQTRLELYTIYSIMSEKHSYQTKAIAKHKKLGHVRVINVHVHRNGETRTIVSLTFKQLTALYALYRKHYIPMYAQLKTSLEEDRR